MLLSSEKCAGGDRGGQNIDLKRTAIITSDWVETHFWALVSRYDKVGTSWQTESHTQYFGNLCYHGVYVYGNEAYSLAKASRN